MLDLDVKSYCPYVHGIESAPTEFLSGLFRISKVSDLSEIWGRALAMFP